MPIHTARSSEGSSTQIHAVIFDIGGVLERVADPDIELGAKWPDKLGPGPGRVRYGDASG